MKGFSLNKQTTLAFALTALVGCVAEPGDEVKQVEQQTAASGARGVILGSSLLGPAKVEANWGGHAAEVKGPTRLIMQEITIDPGGHTGWHTHGGMAFAQIHAGTLSLFDEHHPCEGTDYPPGTAFLDPGGGHTHIARNLGTTPVTVRVQYVLPDGGAVRIDAPAPAGADACP